MPSRNTRRRWSVRGADVIASPHHRLRVQLIHSITYVAQNSGLFVQFCSSVKIVSDNIARKALTLLPREGIFLLISDQIYSLNKLSRISHLVLHDMVQCYASRKQYEIYIAKLNMNLCLYLCFTWYLWITTVYLSIA